MQADVKRKRVKIQWDEGSTNIPDGESSDEDSDVDIDDCNEGCNDEADERESEHNDGDEELGLIDNEELSSDFSETIDDTDTNLVVENDVLQLQSTGYKIVGDNIDKNIRASFQRIDHQTKSVHYFHMFAAKDRAHFSNLSESIPHDIKVNPTTLLPGPTDLATFLNELQVIVSR